MQVSSQLKIQGWWKQGVEVENGWERVWDEWNHEKKKKKKGHCWNSRCIW